MCVSKWDLPPDLRGSAPLRTNEQSAGRSSCCSCNTCRMTTSDIVCECFYNAKLSPDPMNIPGRMSRNQCDHCSRIECTFHDTYATLLGLDTTAAINHVHMQTRNLVIIRRVLSFTFMHGSSIRYACANVCKQFNTGERGSRKYLTSMLRTKSCN